MSIKIWNDNNTNVNFNLYATKVNDKFDSLYLESRDTIRHEVIDRVRFKAERDDDFQNIFYLKSLINFNILTPNLGFFNYTNNFTVFRGDTSFLCRHIINNRESITFTLDFSINTISNLITLNDIDFSIYNLLYFRNNMYIQIEDFESEMFLEWLL